MRIKAKQRSVYIPVARGIAEELLSSLVADFPWIMELAEPGHAHAIAQEEMEDIADSMQAMLYALSKNETRTAKRLIVLFSDRADFGQKPNKNYKRFVHLRKRSNPLESEKKP